MERSDERRLVCEEKSSESTSKFPLTMWEVSAASGIVIAYALGLLGVYLTMPSSDYSFLKLPRTLEDLQILRYPENFPFFFQQFNG